MELLRITRQIHCKAVEQRATLIHRQYNRDWGTSFSRPPIDPYLTALSLLQNPGGVTGPNAILIIIIIIITSALACERVRGGDTYRLSASVWLTLAPCCSSRRHTDAWPLDAACSSVARPRCGHVIKTHNAIIHGGPKKRGHRLVTVILSNLNRF